MKVFRLFLWPVKRCYQPLITVALLNPIPLRFPNLILNSDSIIYSTYKRNPRGSRGLKQIAWKIWIYLIFNQIPINKFDKTVKNSMFFQIEAVFFSFLFKYGQISHVISFLLRLAPVTPGSALLRLTYLLQRSIAEVTECRFLTKWFRRGEQPISISFFL